MDAPQQHTTEKESKTSVLNENVKILLEAPDLPENARSLLENNVDIKSLGGKKIENLLKELKDFIKNKIKQIMDTSENDAKESCYKVLKSCISLLKSFVDNKTISEMYIFRTLVTTLSYILTFKDFDVSIQNQASHLCEKYLEVVGRAVNDNTEIGVCTLNFLLQLTLGKISSKPVTKADIKRVWDLKSFIVTLKLLNPVVENTKKLLLECVTSVTYLSSREGRLHIASILSKDVSLVKPIHQLIKNQIPKLTKNQAAHYGDVYFNAWNMAKADVQKEIEEQCIQDLMERAFTLNRNGLEMSKVGQRTFVILASLHSSRRLHKFSDTITELYSPLIWRYLRSDQALERCNAAQVFLDVFPLERPFNGIVVNSNFRERQLKEMRDLLLDDCHLVRIIAVKGVCYHLTHSLDCLTVSDVKQLLQIITEKLACDGSSYQVRAAVFEGFEYMLSRECSVVLVTTILPHMHLHIHDENEKVRKAFVKLLLKIKEQSEELNLNYWNVVPLKHLVARLCEENGPVGELLATLLMKDIYTKGQPVDRTINRLNKLIEQNHHAPKKLFKYSKNVLDTSDAHAIIISILGTLRKDLKEKIDNEEGENSRRTSHQQPRSSSRKRPKKVLGDISNSSTSEDKENDPNNSSDSGQGETRLIDNHRNVAALISAASTLFAIFSDELLENSKYMEDIYNLSVVFVPFFLLHFKNTIVYYAVINFASLIPITKLAPVSTVAGACMSELKEITEETPEDVLKCLTFSLCAWNRGHEVIELAVEWLNAAFRAQDLSGSVLPIRKTRRATKVRFKTYVGKPMLALRLLNSLLDDYWNEKRLLDKSYNHFYELYVFLERIKMLLEKRLSRGCPFEDSLTDEFLYGCFRRYLLMPSYIHRPQQPPDCASFISDTGGEQPEAVNASKELTKHLTWATTYLTANMPPRDDDDDDDEEEDKPLVVKCLLEVLTTANITISLNLADMVFAKALAIFVLKILETEWNIYFLENSIETVHVLSEHAQAFTLKDEWNLFKTVLPSVLSKVLETVAIADFTSDNISIYITDFKQMRLSLCTCLSIVQRCSGVESDYFKKVFNFYMFSCIEMIVKTIRQEDSFNAYTKLDDHPIMVSVIMKYLLSKGTLSANILPSLNEQITLNKQEGLHILGCLSLLFTLGHCALQLLKRDELETCIHNVHSCIKHFSDPNRSNVSRKEDTTFFTDTEAIDVHQTGDTIVKQLCKHIGCAPKKF